MNFFNLKGKPFTHEDGKYYNLDTSRHNKKIPVGFIVSESYRVIGSLEQLHKFTEVNNLDLRRVLPREYWGKEITVEYASVASDDIALVPDEHLLRLREFSLRGLYLKARVIDVIDGDTVSLAVYVPFESLSQLHIERGNARSCAALPFRSNYGFVIRLRCRLYGIDTAEKKTAKGVAIRERLIKIFLRTDNIIYAQFFDLDKYGRHLVNLFSYLRAKQSINEELLTYKGMTNVYHGGKKEGFEDEVTEVIFVKEKRSLLSRFFR